MLRESRICLWAAFLIFACGVAAAADNQPRVSIAASTAARVVAVADERVGEQMSRPPTDWVIKRMSTARTYNGMFFPGHPSTWISVRMEGYGVDELPAVYEGDGVRKIIVRHEVPDIKGALTHPSGCPFYLNGQMTATLMSWDASSRQVLGTRSLRQWRFGQEVCFDLDLKKVKAGAYVVLVDLPPDIRSEGIFNPTNTGSGVSGRSMLYGRNAMRIAIFPPTPPAKLFGVGNGMIFEAEKFTGATLANTLAAKDLQPVLAGEGDLFHLAILGCPGMDREGVAVDRAGPSSIDKVNNPASGMLDIFTDSGRQILRDRAREIGLRLAKNAGVVAVKLSNEAPHFNRGALCPTAAADASFREFCRTRYNGDLSRANAIWKRTFRSWEEVRQPIYRTDEKAIVKTGAAAYDWYANMGKIGPKLLAYLTAPENIEMAMDWYRWRTKSSIDLYADFVAEAHKYDKKTLYGNNYCWPNFFAHLTMPVWRRHDVAELDCQYLCAFPRTHGRNSEMLEILEMTESVMKERPIIGREIYVQPHYPEEMVAMQNWAMVAHGVDVSLVFAWKPYSDYGAGVFKGGPRAWERPEGSVPMYMLLDTDGTRLPCYEGVRRSAREIADFHARYDGQSLSRVQGGVAIYLSNETSMYTMLVTGDKPYNHDLLCHTRDRLAEGLRLGGVRIEYFDDETIQEVSTPQFYAMIVPPSPRIAPEAAAAIAAYESRGGRVIRLNDGWPKDFFERYPFIVRNAYWMSEEREADVEVVVRHRQKTNTRFVFVLNRKGSSTRGKLAGQDFDRPVKFRDVLTGQSVGRSFELGSWGYRVLEEVK